VVTDWRPTASLEAIKARAGLLSRVRAFFAARGVLEVDTPQLARHGVSDPHIQCIPVPGHGYLQSSPEYHMKRLLAAGSGPIYQICKAYRDGEAGARHNPEFTMLEWYRPGFDLSALINECLTLFGELFPGAPSRSYRFRALFSDVTGLDPLTASDSELVTLAESHGAPDGLNKSAAVDYLMATRVEPALPTGQLSVVTDFPGWAAALAETRFDEDGLEVAHRFEIYYRGWSWPTATRNSPMPPSNPAASSGTASCVGRRVCLPWPPTLCYWPLWNTVYPLAVVSPWALNACSWRNGTVIKSPT